MDMTVQCVVLVLATCLLEYAAGRDKPCAGRFFSGRSCVCMCNATYCDETSRERPMRNRYVAYSSSYRGDRFKKTAYHFQPASKRMKLCLYTLEVEPSVTYQTVEGFGGAVTDSTAMNWHSLEDPRLMKKLVDSYFGERGIKYNMLRVPIGGTDFSVRSYALDDDFEGDVDLKNFALAPEDIKYKIPFIHECQAAAPVDLHVLATTWSPPAWMKDSKRLTGYSRLKKEYYQTYADYHVKFIDHYRQHGIPTWGITTTNEPINGVMSMANINSLGWSVRGLGEFIEVYLGPTMRKHYPDVKIIGSDDQRFLLPIWFNILISEHPGALKYMDGVAVHYYYNQVVPAVMMRNCMIGYPGKFILATEASEGGDGEKSIDFGSWERAENYAVDIIENMNHDVVGWIDWNLCLDMKGGPSWVDNYIDSAIIVNAAAGEFYKQPMFYIIGHFSKFVPRGSKRIKMTEKYNCNFSVNSEVSVQFVGFLTPENTIVVIIYNSGYARVVTLKLDSYNRQAALYLEARSITTVEFPNDSDVYHTPNIRRPPYMNTY